ncbi:tyrosine-type recombinase/integrase [Halococcus sp. AFM35]|uniref:tyrosine-type recombinase/integrase n=1 Tax=Halococcus sp. AFM35 TaxID=3421653 RepID=UPI003EC03B60
MTDRPGVRHTYQDALGERDFQLLLEGATLLDERYRLETRFILLLGGRLGMRAGEICHMHEKWVDWDRQMINIPHYRDCDCGYCREQAKQKVEWSDLSLETAMKERWMPKTDAASRPIPYGFSPRVELVIERFFERFDEFPYSRKTVNRRVNKAAENAKGIDPETTYPHCLRSTAATYHASRGLEPMNLQALMGWSDIRTSQKYVRLTGEHTARALRHIHNR